MRLCAPLLLASVISLACCAVVPESEKDPDFWRKSAKDAITRSVEATPLVGVAKHVVLFLGDGMGIQTVTAARILAGQLQGRTGEEGMLSFDEFQHVALSKTYNVDYQTPDSAGTATAFLCGVKTNFGIIGMDARVLLGHCNTSASREVTSILRWSHDAGKSTGVVTTTRITHATPASAYAHSPDRNWESTVPQGQSPCTDIAYQLVKNNSYINVVLGGGRQYLLPQNFTDPEIGVLTRGRQDGRNLIQDWIDQKASENASAQYVWNLTSFNAVNPETTDYLLGLFEPDHMKYETDRANDTAGEPSLADMTRKAIQILRKNPKGFFLLVEVLAVVLVGKTKGTVTVTAVKLFPRQGFWIVGTDPGGGRIDHAHHATNAAKSLHETLAFSDAIKVARELLDPSDSLLVTTADHSHAFAFAGYPKRGNSILGLVESENGPVLAQDGKTYTTLVYGNGPGFSEGARPNVSKEEASALSYTQQTAVPLSQETHGGEDVAIFAHGVMAHLFHGVHEQHYITHVMAYASCVGDYTDPKDCAAALVTSQTSSAGPVLSPEWSTVAVGLTLAALLHLRTRS